MRCTSPFWNTYVVRGAAISVAFALIGCSKSSETKTAEPARKGPPVTQISIAKAELRTLEITEESVGSLENVIDPKVGAEVAGRVVRVVAVSGQAVKQGQLLAEIDAQDWEIQQRSDTAEIGRLTTLLAQQDRVVERQEKLVASNFISQNAADDAIAQRNALRQQLDAARARFDSSKNSLRKTRVVAPIDGRVEVQIVAAGDFVKVGDPLFQLVGTRRLHAHLPFPESSSMRIKLGLPVKMTSPLDPTKVIVGKIDEIRPTVIASSRALDAVVKFDTDDSIRGGGTINASVVVATRPNAIMVPEQAVVLRPAGKVVYLVNEGRAKQQIVESGYRKDGAIEIISGLKGGETVAVDGAGFLTDNAPVAIPGARGGPGGAGKGEGKGEGKSGKPAAAPPAKGDVEKGTRT